VFAINPHMLLVSCGATRTGVSAPAPRYSKNVRRSICTSEIYTYRVSEWNALRVVSRKRGSNRANLHRASAIDVSEMTSAMCLATVSGRRACLAYSANCPSPSKKDFIAVFGSKGVAWTWEARAKALGLSSAEEVAAKFQSLLRKAAR
jgi:hypothetical protein